MTHPPEPVTLPPLTPGRVRELIERATPGPWQIVPTYMRPGTLSVVARREPRPHEHLEPGESACSLVTQVPLTATTDAALITQAPELAQLVLDQQNEIAQLWRERNDAVQLLVDVVQAQGGQVVQDWSSWRVSFGQGVYRGHGQTDAQQIISAVAQATRKPDPSAPPVEQGQE